MSVFRSAMLTLRFLLELCLLAGLASWGWQAGSSTLGQIGLAIGAPLAAVTVWGAFVAPRAPYRPPMVIWLVVQTALFGAGVAALAAADHTVLAVVFGALVLVNTGLLMWMGALEPEPGPDEPDPRD